MTLREKILTVALRVYGAQGVEYDFTAARQLDSCERNGFGRLPVCIARRTCRFVGPYAQGCTHRMGAAGPEGRASVGTGFIYPICGDMRAMPGLGANAVATRIDIDSRGEIVGLL